MCRKAQFMPQAIHESTAFNSRNRKVAIHSVFSVKDNTLNLLFFMLAKQRGTKVFIDLYIFM
jgi:hypothetical protein